MPKDHQTNGKDTVPTVDTAGDRVARSSRTRTRKSLHITTRHKTAVASKGEGEEEEKFGNPVPKKYLPDVVDVADVADVSPVDVDASANAADGDASPQKKLKPEASVRLASCLAVSD